jgi:HicA toxin of bacterial toxin-antitoxin,
MNQKRLKTLVAIFAEPVRSDISWNDFEALLECLGAELTKGRGSRVRVVLNGVRASFHKPHPERRLGKGMVRSVKEFLINAGIRPNDD